MSFLYEVSLVGMSFRAQGGGVTRGEFVSPVIRGGPRGGGWRP